MPIGTKSYLHVGHLELGVHKAITSYRGAEPISHCRAIKKSM